MDVPIGRLTAYRAARVATSWSTPRSGTTANAVSRTLPTTRECTGCSPETHPPGSVEGRFPEGGRCLERRGPAREAVRLLGPALRALDPDIGGVATVRFQLTGEGNVRDRRIVESSGHEALDEAIATIADAFEFSPGATLAGATEVPMEYVVGFQSERRARLLRWLSAIGD